MTAIPKVATVVPKRNMKKADANIFWVIIGAVLALVVLFILIYAFVKGTGDFWKGISNCGGHCESGKSNCKTDEVAIPNSGCKVKDTDNPIDGYCCKPLT